MEWSGPLEWTKFNMASTDISYLYNEIVLVKVEIFDRVYPRPDTEYNGVNV